MSIIYDALKKVEEKLPGPAAGSPAVPGITPLKIGLLATAVLLAGYGLAALAFSSRYVQDLIRGDTAVPAALPQPRTAGAPQSAPLPRAVRPAQKTSYILNGVFSANNANYALVNNTIVQAGDMIGAAKVTSITAEGVDLEENGQPVRLSTKK